MSRNKSIFITLVMAAMLAVILVGAHKFETRAFYALLALLAGYGFLRGSGDLCHWMQSKEKPIPVIEGEEVKIEDEDPFAHDDEFAETEGFAQFGFGKVRFQEGEFHGAESD